MPEIPRVLAVVGDPNQIGAWSGIPYFFLQAGKKAGIPFRRPVVAAGRLAAPAALLELRSHVAWKSASSIPASLCGGSSPRRNCGTTSTSRSSAIFRCCRRGRGRAAGAVSCFIDATLQQNFTDYGLADRVGAKLARMRSAGSSSTTIWREKIVCMSRWAADSVAGAHAAEAGRASVGSTAAAGVTCPHGAAGSLLVLRAPRAPASAGRQAAPERLDRAWSPA